MSTQSTGALVSHLGPSLLQREAKQCQLKATREKRQQQPQLQEQQRQQPQQQAQRRLQPQQWQEARAAKGVSKGERLDHPYEAGSGLG